MSMHPLSVEVFTCVPFLNEDSQSLNIFLYSEMKIIGSARIQHEPLKSKIFGT